MFCSCCVLFNFGAMPKRLKGPRSVDQNKARRALEEHLIVHFLSPSQPHAGNVAIYFRGEYVLV